MTNSKQKGKRGELEVTRILKDHGIDAHRGQQYCGANGDADVIGLPGYHLEVKRCENYQIDKWFEQATSDARDGEVPLVVFRKSRSNWKVVLEFDDFLELINK